MIADILIRLGLDPTSLSSDAVFHRLSGIVMANLTLANMLAQTALRYGTSEAAPMRPLLFRIRPKQLLGPSRAKSGTDGAG